MVLRLATGARLDDRRHDQPMNTVPRRLTGLRWVLFGATAMLAGCATYHARPLDPDASARSLEARSLRDARLSRFVDLDLGRSGQVHWDLAALTAAAVYERPDMTIASDQVRVAQGGEETAAEWPNPVLGLSTTYNSSLLTPSPWKIGPVVTDLIRTAGKRSTAIREARARTAAARQQLAVAAWTLRSHVRSALIALWAARQRVVLSRRYAKAAAEMASLVEARFHAGMVSAATLTAERLTETQAALDLAAAQRQARLAEAGLAAAVGVPERAIAAVRIDMAGLDHLKMPGNLSALRHSALTKRPEVLAAIDRYEAAQQALKLAIARQYPDLNIGPGYHYDQGDNKFILAVSLPLPVFNQNQGPIASARAARDLAAAQFDKVQTTVLAQVETAAADWNASLREVGRIRRLLALAQQAVRSDRTDFRAGQIGRLTLVGAELARAQTELGVLSARDDERTALGRLEDAFHRPFIDPERP